MEGFLRGKCLPGDMKVNESNAQYLVRKFSEFESKLSESQREFRAADATIHNLELKLTDMAVQLANAESKCRELAAENAELKYLIEQHANSVAVCPNCSHEEPSETDDIVALYRSLKTPATDAFLAEVRAQGVEMLLASLPPHYTAKADIAEFAAQLRKGAAL
jgi:chromosome segregation ATPase